ncbi:hypothetical protein Pmar_PMAR001674 [Perkinsus marinus ATCC 50983]|uniref:GTP-eEF1A C-terminal domain-containing protein n=1 Tax=Perkinsus marinus (strain ATCC 50983 / TXsc) TaxID=423536 RepID=C5LM26_PERM5|nr:hypothetical protein Pmar_PMAR001674 [Perkinsus marinus ATCC 50983]EER02211.1 hypothetical protein Pmar_PMAR001674 [Perkinsus marinus ATCC 50983]|eukprot:XP_002769493.1 hypothetical protein Pmar_PMAR001674 [Perkinsus marinus ATCC 50983]
MRGATGEVRPPIAADFISNLGVSADELATAGIEIDENADFEDLLVEQDEELQVSIVALLQGVWEATGNLTFNVRELNAEYGGGSGVQLKIQRAHRRGNLNRTEFLLNDLWIMVKEETSFLPPQYVTWQKIEQRNSGLPEVMCWMRPTGNGISERRAVAGDNIGIKIEGVTSKEVRRGQVLCCIGDAAVGEYRRVDAHVVMVNFPGELRPGYSPVIDIGTASSTVQFKSLKKRLHRTSGTVLENDPELLIQVNPARDQHHFSPAVQEAPIAKSVSPSVEDINIAEMTLHIHSILDHVLVQCGLALELERLEVSCGDSDDRHEILG